MFAEFARKLSRTGESSLSQNRARGRFTASRRQVRNRIFFKLLAAFALVVLVTAFTLDTSIRADLETFTTRQIQRNLIQKALLLAHRVENRSATLAADHHAGRSGSRSARHGHRSDWKRFLADSAGRPCVDGKPTGKAKN